MTPPITRSFPLNGIRNIRGQNTPQNRTEILKQSRPFQLRQPGQFVEQLLDWEKQMGTAHALLAGLIVIDRGLKSDQILEQELPLPTEEIQAAFECFDNICQRSKALQLDQSHEALSQFGYLISSTGDRWTILESLAHFNSAFETGKHSSEAMDSRVSAAAIITLISLANGYKIGAGYEPKHNSVSIHFEGFGFHCYIWDNSKPSHLHREEKRFAPDYTGSAFHLIAAQIMECHVGTEGSMSRTELGQKIQLAWLETCRAIGIHFRLKNPFGLHNPLANLYINLRRTLAPSPLKRIEIWFYPGFGRGIAALKNIKEIADKSGVTGWVKDASINGNKFELLVEGKERELESFRSSLEPHGQARNLSLDTPPATGEFSTFEIRHF